MSKILLTGHRGNICKRLNESLLQDGHEVFGVDIKDGVDCADVTNLNSFRGVDTIFHLAAHLEHPKKNTIEACHGILDFAKQENAKIIYASSAAIYNPTSLYAAHKLYGEALFRHHHKDTAILRLFNVYGGDGIGLIDKIQRKEHIKVNGSGEQRRDYVHINDVVEAFLTAFNVDMVGEVDIGTGMSHSVNQVLVMANHNDYEHVIGDGGVKNSQAEIHIDFPWHPKYDIKTFLADLR